MSLSDSYECTHAHTQVYMHTHTHTHMHADMYIDKTSQAVCANRNKMIKQLSSRFYTVMKPFHVSVDEGPGRFVYE